MTPLHVAALHGQCEVAQTLIDSSADVNATCKVSRYTVRDASTLLIVTNLIMHCSFVDMHRLLHTYTYLRKYAHIYHFDTLD